MCLRGVRHRHAFEVKQGVPPLERHGQMLFSELDEPDVRQGVLHSSGSMRSKKGEKRSEASARSAEVSNTTGKKRAPDILASSEYFWSFLCSLSRIA